jgi:rhodanese-related sulfurtransferase
MGENFTRRGVDTTRLAAVRSGGGHGGGRGGSGAGQALNCNSAKGRIGVFMVSPNVLYRSKHIPGSGRRTGTERAGLAMLKAEAGKLPRDREVVLYCGCCPWDRCPNVKPAVDLLKQMGFAKVKALYLATGFKADWLDKGYAAEAPQ